MIKKWIEKICRYVLSEYFRDKTVYKMTAGYDPLPLIRNEIFTWIYLPFNGGRVWCNLRSLNANQIETCGDFALLQNIAKNTEKATHSDVIKMRNAQEKLAVAVLNRPTYKDIEKLIFDDDNVIKEKKDELESIKNKIKKNKGKLTAAQFTELQNRVNELEFFVGYILPEDTFGFLTKWALGIDITEIKSLSRQKLLEAAILAENAKKAPTDYISGIFTDRDKSEIDKAAWIIFNEYQEEEKTRRENNGRRRR
ncbi:MAG: hypothetical protein LBQ37_02455 [Elusimicrobiota bacterium]|jgi:hypothetical protein|nr:hypothetical protein [Elusimicrobiota bacterium]